MILTVELLDELIQDQTSNLTRKLIIPEGYTEISLGRQGFFLYGNFIEEIIFPKSLNKINDVQTFVTSSLKVVKFHPESLIKTLPNDCFSYSFQLEEVILPNCLEEIGAGGFNMCRCLKYINFPKTLKSIGEDAFNDCRDLPNLVQWDPVISKKLTSATNVEEFKRLSTEIILEHSLLHKKFYKSNLIIDSIELKQPGFSKYIKSIQGKLLKTIGVDILDPKFRDFK